MLTFFEYEMGNPITQSGLFKSLIKKTHIDRRKAVFMCFGHKSRQSVWLPFPPRSLLTGVQIGSKKVKSAVMWNEK